ncbi:hypothetical protein M2168_002233 [Streptomyces sp. CZ24]|uniref:hypothetical protein n=1 Tax=Streptomyces sp. ADI96-15 TaxID=1522761 RepID=UPI000F555E8F|nr:MULTISPECIES: hypothetical protein [unclassified Streptomyces]MDH6189201.1 hypothetical protein [Streptomyces sp. CZ24]
MLSPGLLTLWTRQAMQGARAQDDELVGEITGRLADQGDALDLLAACRVMAHEARRALLTLYGGPDVDRGEAWVLDQLGDAAHDPARLFAARLVTAYANGDHDHVTALVAAAAGASPVERAESLRSLVTYAAELTARAALD